MDTERLRNRLLRAFDEAGFVAPWTAEELTVALAILGKRPGLSRDELLARVPKASVGADGELRLEAPERRHEPVEGDVMSVEQRVLRRREVQGDVAHALGVEVGRLLAELGVPEELARRMEIRDYDEAVALVSVLRTLLNSRGSLDGTTKDSDKGRTREKVRDRETEEEDGEPEEH